MTPGLEIVLDASIVEVREDFTRDEIDKFVENISNLYEIAQDERISVLAADFSIESLLRSDDNFANNIYYYMYYRLGIVIKNNVISEFDRNTVFTCLKGILKSRLEDIYHIAYLLQSPPQVESETGKESVPKLTEDQCVLMTICAMLDKYGQALREARRKEDPDPVPESARRKHSAPQASHVLMMRQAQPQTVTLKTTLEDLDDSGYVMPSDFPTPVCTFDGRVKVGAGFADMLQHADACALMESAPDDRALEVAIRIALCRPDKGGRALTWSESGRFRIGRKFRKSCQGVCRTQPKAVNEAILRAIVEAVRKEKTNDTHELRNTDEGGSGTRMRGKDKAVRRDVDDDLHLHYWDCDDGLIELGSVVHHNDFSIPY